MLSLSKWAMRKFLLLIVFGLGLLLAIFVSLTPPTQIASSPTPHIAVYDDASFIAANSLTEISNRSTIIVTGRLSNTNTFINMARNPQNIATPSLTTIVIGQVYQVTVGSYIRGQGDSTIFVVQPEGFLNPIITQTPNAIEVARTAYPAILPKANTDYLMFLRPLAGFPNQQYFVGAINPWRFDISNPNAVVPESPWEGAPTAFPPEPLTVIEQQIPTSTPSFTPTSTNTATLTPTNTGTPTLTPSSTFTPTSTATFTPSSTFTPTATPTPTVSDLKAKVSVCVSDHGLANSLNVKIDHSQWTAFINEVEAQSGKKIDQPCADQMITTATFFLTNPPPTPTPSK